MSLKDTFQTIKQELGKPYEDLEFLLRSLKSVLEKNGESDIAGAIPWISEQDPVVGEIHSQAHPALFDDFSSGEHGGDQRRGSGASLQGE